MTKEVKILMEKLDSSTEPDVKRAKMLESVLNFFGEDFEEKTSFEKEYTYNDKTLRTICIGYKENPYPELVFYISTAWNQYVHVGMSQYSCFYETNMRQIGYFHEQSGTILFFSNEYNYKGIIVTCDNGLRYYRLHFDTGLGPDYSATNSIMFTEAYASYKGKTVKTLINTFPHHGGYVGIRTRSFDEFGLTDCHGTDESATAREIMLPSQAMNEVSLSLFGGLDRNIILNKFYIDRRSIEITGPVFIRMPNNTLLREFNKGIELDGKNYMLIQTTGECCGYLMMPDFKE